jgi:hypothetical protein
MIRKLPTVPFHLHIFFRQWSEVTLTIVRALQRAANISLCGSERATVPFTIFLCGNACAWPSPGSPGLRESWCVPLQSPLFSQSARPIVRELASAAGGSGGGSGGAWTMGSPFRKPDKAFVRGLAVARAGAFLMRPAPISRWCSGSRSPPHIALPRLFAHVRSSGIGLARSSGSKGSHH